MKKIKKMVTYFNRKDLVSFGNYLMSEKRKAKFNELYNEAIRNGMTSIIPTEERLKEVHHSDIENWMLEQQNN